ncbi:hypothetical protein FE257_001087 [Aspergillus nanangensis]|uniref:Uncharacterized protein n=1 Tax=Aspergillus nanangensis TaxID=2582783 RepID=A0AAD4CU04_ASPNN|nr:hypothetical protein FE257_001087 [Aspergillus nanangensis]
MNPLLNDSPDSPPQDNPSHLLSLCEASDEWDIRDAAQKGQLDILQSVTYNRAWYVAFSYCRSGDGIDECTKSLHDLCREQETLLLEILSIRGRGPLTRRAPGGVGVDIARTPDGTVWNDLPFFVTDMTEFWHREFAAMSITQRVNASTFLAKLASTRVANDRLCQIGLKTIRDTLETMRPLGSSNDPDEECPRRSLGSLPIAGLLPAACAWLREASHNIILLSDACWNDRTNSAIGNPGYLFVESELGQRSPGGFSPWRWLFWFKRLHELYDEANEAEEKVLAEYAEKAINIMNCHVKERNARILRVFESAGDSLQQEKAFQGLKAKFAMMKSDYSDGMIKPVIT